MMNIGSDNRTATEKRKEKRISTTGSNKSVPPTVIPDKQCQLTLSKLPKVSFGQSYRFHTAPKKVGVTTETVAETSSLSSSQQHLQSNIAPNLGQQIAPIPAQTFFIPNFQSNSMFAPVNQNLFLRRFETQRNLVFAPTVTNADAEVAARECEPSSTYSTAESITTKHQFANDGSIKMKSGETEQRQPKDITSPVTTTSSSSTQYETDASLESIIERQRKLIAQLVKIIVKDKLAKDSETAENHLPGVESPGFCDVFPGEHSDILLSKHVSSPTVLSKSVSGATNTCPTNTNVFLPNVQSGKHSPSDGIASHEEVSLTKIVSNLVKDVPENNTTTQSGFNNTESWIRASACSSTENRLAMTAKRVKKSKKRGKRSKIADSELPELRNRNIDLLSPNGKGETDETEHPQQLSSLEYDLDKDVVTTNFAEQPFAPRSDCSKKLDALYLEPRTTPTKNLHLDKIAISEKQDPGNKIIVIDDEDLYQITTPACSHQESTDMKSAAVDCVSIADEKNKRSRGSAIKTSASRQQDEKNKNSDFMAEGCRRSPRKRPKRSVGVERYVRRSASKQARKKIISQLKYSDSEFSPPSDSSEHRYRKNSRRKLLPPKLDQTFEDEKIHEGGIDDVTRQDMNFPTDAIKLGDTDDKNALNDILRSERQPDPAVTLVNEKDENTVKSSVDAVNLSDVQSVPFITPLHNPNAEGSAANFSLETFPLHNSDTVFKDNILEIELDIEQPLDLTTRTSEPVLQGNSRSNEPVHSSTSVAIYSESLPLDLSIRRTTDKHLQNYLNQENVKTHCTFTKENVTDYFGERISSRVEKEFRGGVGESVIDFSVAKNCAAKEKSFEEELQGNKPVHKIDENYSMPPDEKSRGEELCREGHNDKQSSHSDIKTDCETWEPKKTKHCGVREMAEFDFTLEAPQERSLKYWLSRKKRFPNSIFSFARGHGVGFLRRSRSRGLSPGGGVGSTIDALHKVAKAKTIWKKMAKSGKLGGYMAPGVKERSLRHKTQKNRLLLMLGDSSRQDDSSDEADAQKVKRLKKRRDFRRSYLAKQVSKSRLSNACDSSHSRSQEDEFPFVINKTSDSSEVDMIPESSPSLTILTSENRASSNFTPHYESDSPKLRIQTSENSSPVKSYCDENEARQTTKEIESNRFVFKKINEVDIADNVSNLQDACSDHFYESLSSESSGREEHRKSVKPKLSAPSEKLAKGVGTSVTVNKSKSIDNSDVADIPEKGSFHNLASSQGVTSAGFVANQPHKRDKAGDLVICIKQEVTEDESELAPFPTSSNRADDINVPSHHHWNFDEEFRSDCVVNISPLKYRRHGTQWLISDNDQKANSKGKSPLRKTFVKCKVENDVLFNVIDEVETKKEIPSNGDEANKRKRSKKSKRRSSSRSNKIAELTMVPRKACSKAKKKISQLAKSSSKSTKK